MTTKPKVQIKFSNPDVLGRAGNLVAVKEGTGRYPFKVVRPEPGGHYTNVSQGYSSEAEALADLRLRTGGGC